MQKHILFLCAVFVIVFSISSVYGSESIQPIVSAEWLSGRLHDPGVMVLDIRKVEDYKEGHIPGALSLTYAAWRTMENNMGCQLPHKDELSDTICSSGIQADTHVVIVGNVDTERQLVNATRVAWTLKYAGVRHPSILNGGFKKWVSSKYLVSTDWVNRPKSNYKCKWNENVLTKKEHVRGRLGTSVIVDTRPVKLYRGEKPDPMLKRKGHIPGAINLPYSLVFAKDGTFENTAKLKSLVSRVAGDTKDKEIIVLCCDGQFASSWWFALSEILRYRDVKIYDGSMEEWCGDKDLPLE